MIPPLLNDFIGLQKDTALVAFLGVHRGAPAGADHPDAATSTSRRTSRSPSSSSASRSRRRRFIDWLIARERTHGRGGGASCDRGDPDRGLRKSFGDLEVLAGIDLTVDDHEVVCLIGASGSGKSTLLRCIDLLEPVDAGRIWIEGDEVTAAGVDQNAVRRRIGIVFQAFNLFPHMTVMRNVTLAQEKALGRSSAEADAEGDRAARAVRPGRQGRRLPGPALRRPAAARRDRAGARDGPRRDAPRRGHERSRPGPRGRGARRDPRAGRRRA